MQLQFSIVDSANAAASPEEIQRKFRAVIQADLDDDDILSRVSSSATNNGTGEEEDRDVDADDIENEPDTSDETDSASKPGTSEKKQKKKRIARLRRKSIAVRAYDFVGKGSDVSGIIFMEIQKITDLPPERNSKFPGKLLLSMVL